MTLYRIDWEWDEEVGFGYEVRKSYEYVAGEAKLGKAVYKGVLNGQTPAQIVKLNWSLKALLICLRNIESDHYNLTSK